MTTGGRADRAGAGAGSPRRGPALVAEHIHSEPGADPEGHRRDAPAPAAGADRTWPRPRHRNRREARAQSAMRERVIDASIVKLAALAGRDCPCASADLRAARRHQQSRLCRGDPGPRAPAGGNRSRRSRPDPGCCGPQSHASTEKIAEPCASRLIEGSLQMVAHGPAAGSGRSRNRATLWAVPRRRHRGGRGRPRSSGGWPPAPRQRPRRRPPPSEHGPVRSRSSPRSAGQPARRGTPRD